MDRGLVKFLVNAAVGLVVAALVSWSRGLFQAEDAAMVFSALCDGFFMAAALLLAGGGLTWCVNGGVMDGLSYTAKTAIARVRRDFEQSKKSFADYREEREKKATSPKWMLLAGLAHLAIAFAFMALYTYI